jgi:hypothetical protein
MIMPAAAAADDDDDDDANTAFSSASFYSYTPHLPPPSLSLTIPSSSQIITGNEFFIIDPSGAHLPSEEAPSSGSLYERDYRRAAGGGRSPTPQALRPIGQRCQLDAEMLSRFPDQVRHFLLLLRSI